MGSATSSQDSLEKGDGYRIVQVSKGSPFEGKVEAFFDFIVDIILSQAEPSSASILDKLSNQPEVRPKKSPMQILSENVGRTIKVKIVSTKYRNIRTIEVNLIGEGVKGSDKIGLSVRKERFDQVFDTYFPVDSVQPNSPVKKAGIREGQYLIACQEYPYKTIDVFMEGLYERFFNKEIKDKSVNLVVYDIVTDCLLIKEVVLQRGWGGKGLLGCEFLQGLLNKFPHNLEQQRKELSHQETKKRETEKLRNQLGDCDGASKSLIESLHNQKSKKARHFKNIKNLLSIHPPSLNQLNKAEQGPKMHQLSHQDSPQSQDPKRMDYLQQRVAFLQQSLFSVRQYLTKMQLNEESVQQ